MKRYFLMMCFAGLAVSTALAQEKKTVPPPPKPADDGPTLEVTTKFIQEKMNDHGTVGYVLGGCGGCDGRGEKHDSLLSDAVTDVSTCTLHVKHKATMPDRSDWEDVVIITSPFKDVDSIAVESAQDMANRQAAENGHPEVSVSYTPAVYLVSLHGTKKGAFSFQNVYQSGNGTRQTYNSTGQQISFLFRDEQTADRVAKAMLHATELCGGGNKEPF